MRLISEIVVRFDCSELMPHLEMLRALGESYDTKENKLLALNIFFLRTAKGAQRYCLPYRPKVACLAL